MEDDRAVSIEFIARNEGIEVVETFTGEDTYPPEARRQGWQDILDNFARYTEALDQQAQNFR